MTEAALFYETANAGLGDDFLDDIQHAINTIQKRPELGAKVAHGFRRMLVRRFPFSLIYAVESEQLIVVAVATSGAGLGSGRDAYDC